MAIRLRRLNGRLVALCAARSTELIGDIYLDDAAHHALTNKFAQDFASMGFGDAPFDPEDAELREVAESNNPNRAEWERQFGALTHKLRT